MCAEGVGGGGGGSGGKLGNLILSVCVHKNQRFIFRTPPPQASESATATTNDGHAAACVFSVAFDTSRVAAPNLVEVMTMVLVQQQQQQQQQ